MNIHARSLLYNTDNLDSTSKAILLTLITYCHGDKDACYPSTRDIAKMSGYAKRTIRKHLRILEGKDFVKTTKEKERKTHKYQILGLYGGRMNSGTECLQSSNPEGLQENTYGVNGGRFDGRKPPKASGVCDLDQSDVDQRPIAPKRVGKAKSQSSIAPKRVEESESQSSIAPKRVEESESQSSIAPKRVGKAKSQSSIAPKRVEESESQNSIAPKRVEESESQNSIAPKRVEESESQNSIAPKRVEESESQNKASFRFEGPLTTQKIVEIYNLYTRQGWIRRSYDSFLAFVSNCSLVKRLRKRNPYGYLTWIYKKKFDRKLITAKDEKLAMAELKLIQNMGIMPDFTEAQRYQTTPPEAPVPPPPAPAPPSRLSTSRPAMDWPEKNLPETGKEAALAKKVEHRQLTNVHPNWLQGMGCWIVKVRKVDGKRFYEQQNLTPDGWFEVAGMTEIVPLINSESKRISQACFIEILASGGFFASDPTLPAT
jgi:hypothetical protein